MCKTNEEDEIVTEKEYCASCFAEKFKFLGDKPIALYGCGANVRAILENSKDYNIVCLVDDNAAGEVINECVVVSFLQFLELDLDTLIIAAQTQSAELVYKRIAAICKANGVTLYNMYGNDMLKLHADITNKLLSYQKLQETDLEKQIDLHEVICFDIDNTLLTPKHIYVADIIEEINNSLKEKGIFIDDFATKIEDIRKRNIYGSFISVIEEAEKTENITEDQRQIIRQVSREELLKEFVPRRAVVDAFFYAIRKNKVVYFMEDMQNYRISTATWTYILDKLGISGYKGIISSEENQMNKYTGLFRKLEDVCAGVSCLHIGDQLEPDVLVPQLYGIDTFYIKRPFDAYQEIETAKVTREILDRKTVRVLLEKYILETYNDDYLPDKVKCRRAEMVMAAHRLENKIKIYSQGGENVTFEPVLFDDIILEKDICNYPKLNFKKYENPEVSIVIPVYNQFGYTYNCLKSILKHTGDEVSYEIIIADDCSTDQVRELEIVAPNIKIIHNEKNLRFLLNCNNAAKYAEGKYILFLNNDTQVQPDWLKPLLTVMENHINAGMVGSKLVYPNGSLQEAGGILWKDGSAWNYGHMKNPEDPEFCYVKETDYISGAAIMIKKSLWETIGGFAPEFAPAYYEDTDLAFEVRRHGYKVYLQPASVVVHFEGVSNGTNTSSGLKAYQVINKKKFYDKWKETLQSEHFENGSEVYLAKDRGQTKKQILVVDHYVPNYDKDAGGRCTYMYLKAFLKMGLKVTFIGDNFAKPEPYTTELNQLGVEVLWGNYYYNNWKEWLKENLCYFDYVYLQRPHISIKYIDIVKEYARGKIFYFAHDLHHVRLYRDYQITGNVEALKESQKWKKIEYELFSKADVGHVVGSYEQQLMQTEFPDKPIRNIPLYIYDEVPQDIEKDFAKRKDILFVGGFGHEPNIDAVLWFAQSVYPIILKKYPNMVWHIIGSKAPEEIQRLAGKNIVLEGFVPDEKMAELYKSCRLAVVPLRYGAGVKGKVVEASYYQIPLVTTTIGGEGLDNTLGSFVMEDDAGKMAELICDIYEDYDRLRRMSDRGVEFIQTYFTSQVAENVLKMDMDR